MSEISRLQDQLRRAFSGGAWHGDSVSEILADVSAELAFRKPKGAAHSIWEIALHIAAWERVALQRLSGPFEIKLNSEQDWPPVPTCSPEGWNSALELLRSGHQKLLGALGGLPEAKLESVVPGTDYTYYVLLHGVVQHDIYHAGQMAVLKRQLRSETAG